MRPADRAWLVLATGVVAYDLAAPDGETLSEGADRYLLAHRWLTRGAAFVVTLHCCNLFPIAFDPLHHLFALLRRWR
ncbi:hypothetical protein ABW16_21675 [Mycolicibacter heraklionensis]|uniref:Uncharacterized protein n=1 Tax=Mycolicibacter heraklionensis TaxID=512402 RepID=A0ABR5FA44_9MYCO|nr:hypothetical protein [Mycolicibacter heraklionensis]KLO25917.1 hypothetical protein ABW16_21675 [Mycolicibacter heraklionensis]